VRLVILSGRSLRDIRARVGLRNVVYGGCHGLEIAGAGLRFKHPRAGARASGVRVAARLLARELRRFPGAFLERKGMTVSVHYRGVSRARRADVLSLAARVARRVPGIATLPGKNVVEFLPRVDWGKGRAVRWIARRLALTLPSRQPLILYAGDDATDEAAFAALTGRGITVRVGAERGGADYAVRGVRDMHTLMHRVARVIG